MTKPILMEGARPSMTRRDAAKLAAGALFAAVFAGSVAAGGGGGGYQDVCKGSNNFCEARGPNTCTTNDPNSCTEPYFNSCFEVSNECIGADANTCTHGNSCAGSGAQNTCDASANVCKTPGDGGNGCITGAGNTCNGASANVCKNLVNNGCIGEKGANICIGGAGANTCQGMNTCSGSDNVCRPASSDTSLPPFG